MKHKSVLLALVAVSALFFAFYLPDKDGKREAALMQSLLQHLRIHHYKPLDIDDNFSEKLYSLFLKRLDESKRWLTKADLAKLEPFKLQLDNQANAGVFTFLDLVIKQQQKAIKKTNVYYREFLSKPFDFTVNESFELDREKIPFAKNDEELREYWRLNMKWETIIILSEKLEQKERGTEEYKDKSEIELEADARKEVLKVYDDWFETLEKRKRSDFLNTYLSAFTNVFDPYTDYLDLFEVQEIDQSQNGRLEGIGAQVITDGEFTVVHEIIVGGPAWKQGILKKNDKIVKVAQDHNGAWTDITGMLLNDVIQLIRGKRGTVVRLTIRKPDGSSREISVVRDEVIIEEGFAKSFRLQTEDKEPIGLIYLPKFYADFDHENGRRCANDVAVEIEKLKQEGVRGIIIDLRDNGGGIVGEATKMVGLFIEQGPVMQVLSRERFVLGPNGGPPVLSGGKPEVIADDDPSVLYDGPMIVLVNKYSASATEIFAAAMQDYGRALIIGVGNSTRGKGTATYDFDLDDSPLVKEKFKPLGEVRITMSLSYRVNGMSYHLDGVVPDISLPDKYMYFEEGAKYHDNSLPKTQVESVAFEQKVYDLNNLEEIQLRSEDRTRNNKVFSDIYKYAALLKKRDDESLHLLNLESYRNNLVDDFYEIDIEDYYLEEILHVMQDMIALKH